MACFCISPFIIKGSQGRNLGAGTVAEAMELLTIYSVCFLVEPRVTTQN